MLENTNLNITPAEALALGWSIIPATRSKTPMLTSWKAYQSRQPTTEELTTWLTRKPAAWAIVTGAISQRFTLDFDGEQGIRTMQALHLNPHRTTPSGGAHVDIIHPGWHVSSLNGKTKFELGERWPGMDIRGDGAYALFAGQTDRGAYTCCRPPASDSLELLPAELVQFLQAPAAGNGAGRSLNTQLIQLALGMIERQGRNNSGFWLAMQLRDNSFSQSDALEVMQIYRAQCPTTNSKGKQEEYRESEMMRSLDQAYGKPAREPWSSQQPTPAAPEPTTAPEPAAAPEPTGDIEAASSHKHFIVRPRGVFFRDEETGAESFICSKLQVLAYARDQNSEAWGKFLKWCDPAGKDHTWIAPMRMLAGDGLAFREVLSDGGLEIGNCKSINALLVQFVRGERPDRHMFAIPHVGWFNQAFVFPESAIPEDADVGYQSVGKGEHFYRTRGTLASWQENVSRRCIGNSRLIFAVSAAFAGPLMRPLNIQGGGFHFRAFSSMGKSTTQYVAGSVWGGGGRFGFARTWAATKNALESTAEIHNDGCLILDEIRMVDPREVEQIIYMLANGSGKSRENRTMTGRRTLQWLCMVLSSGEIQLSDCAALAGQKIKGGAEIRMATIPADAHPEWGIFENLHDTGDPRILAETLEAAAKEHYGTAIREFLECLIVNWEPIISQGGEFIESVIREEMEQLPGASSEVRRVLRRFALCAYAGEVATEQCITGWREGDAQRAAIKCFHAWLINRGGIEPSDIINALRQIRSIIAAQQSRFRPAEPSADDKPERIPNALGYWKRTDDDLLYLVDPNAFKTELCAGYEPRDILKELRKRKLLFFNEADRSTCKFDVTMHSGDIARLRFYAIKSAILEEE